MGTQNSKDSMERYLGGRPDGTEIAHVEISLVEADCGEGLEGECHLIQAVLPESKVQNVGILLVGEYDSLYCRFRSDLVNFAGDQAGWLEQLCDDISVKAKELGAQTCLEWLVSIAPSMLQISPCTNVTIENSPAETMDLLFAKHMRTQILAFRTHLPQYSLEAAAGKFGKQMATEPEGWVEVHTELPLTDDMFVAHVEGHSMEPKTPDRSLCAFRSKFTGPWDGKMLLIEQYGESGGSRYTVKLCRDSTVADPNRPGDAASDRKLRALGEFLFVVGLPSEPSANEVRCCEFPAA